MHVSHSHSHLLTPLDWFKGLSNKFIAAKPSKLLVLAGADKLDTPLMIAQMQGKFQLNVIQNVGHCLQEVSVFIMLSYSTHTPPRTILHASPKSCMHFTKGTLDSRLISQK